MLKSYNPVCVKLSLVISVIALFISYLPVNECNAGQNDQEKRFVTQLEIGPVWQSRNDVQIPNISAYILPGKFPIVTAFVYCWHP
jgi:hypothetical protein